MKKFLLSTLGFAFALLATKAAVPTGWSTNYPAVLAEAKSQQLPALAYFTASWCGPCKMMARTTFTNAIVLDALTNFSRVALDIDEQSELAQQHAIQAVPTFVMFSPSGEEIARVTGYREAGPFVEWLTNSLGEAKKAIAHRRELDQRLTTLEGLLRATDADSTQKAATELFNLCAEKDDAVRKSAITALSKLAERDADVVLNGLNHPRLATRIEVANLLRSKLGERFDIDPWSDATTRKNAIASLRGRLTTKQ